MRLSFTFPVNLSLRDKRCLIFGLGEVGMRKLKSLVAAEASEVLILDLRSREELQFDDLSPCCTRLHFRRRCWLAEDLEGVFLVFACSSDKEKNQALCSLCQTKNILCDNVSNPNSGNFISPARVEAAPLMATLGSGGASPLLTARLKAELGEWLRPWALLASFMEILRPHVLASKLPQAERREIFLNILDSPISVWLEQRDYEQSGQWLLDNLPFLTKNDLKEIFRILECFRPTQ